MAAYEQDDEQILGENPDGVLLLTEQGYFSVVITKKDSYRFQYDNPVLATDEELTGAFNNCRSYCGCFAVVSKQAILEFSVEQSLFMPRLQKIEAQFELSEDMLTLRWNWQKSESDETYLIVEQWVKVDSVS